MPATVPYPLRLTEAIRKEITRTSEAVNLSFPDTMRQAMIFGLPIVEKKLSVKTPSPRRAAVPPR